MKGTNVKVCAVSDPLKAGRISQESRFVCERCGATAHSSRNVCVPAAIEPDH